MSQYDETFDAQSIKTLCNTDVELKKGVMLEANFFFLFFVFSGLFFSCLIFFEKAKFKKRWLV